MTDIMKRDQNFATVLGGVTDNSAQDVTMLRVDPTTKRLLVSATGINIGVSSFNTLSGAVTISAGSNISFVTVGNNIQITASPNPATPTKVVTVTQSATPAINTDTTDVAYITGLAQAVTSFTTSLTGTPINGQTLIIDITDNGTGRALTFGSSFEESTVTFPSTTVAGVKLTIGFRWNIVTSKWTCVAKA